MLVYLVCSHTNSLCHSDRANKGERSESPKPQEAVLAHMFAQTLLCVNVTFPCATKEFGVYIPPRALCCALGDPLDGALLRRFGMTCCAARRVTTDLSNHLAYGELRRSLQESNIPHRAVRKCWFIWCVRTYRTSRGTLAHRYPVGRCLGAAVSKTLSPHSAGASPRPTSLCEQGAHHLHFFTLINVRFW